MCFFFLPTPASHFIIIVNTLVFLSHEALLSTLVAWKRKTQLFSLFALMYINPQSNFPPPHLTHILLRPLEPAVGGQRWWQVPEKAQEWRMTHRLLLETLTVFQLSLGTGAGRVKMYTSTVRPQPLPNDILTKRGVDGRTVKFEQSRMC